MILRNRATGMVWKTCENIQTLPLSNKAAYRRSIMEVPYSNRALNVTYMKKRQIDDYHINFSF